MRIYIITCFIVTLVHHGNNATAIQAVESVSGVNMSHTMLANIESNALEAVKNIDDEMKAALKIHEDAENIDEEYESAQAFVKLIDRYPSEWLPAYWASYLQTQLTNILMRDTTAVPPEGITKQVTIKSAQKYFDIAKERIGSMTASEEADFYNLQALIYVFIATASDTDEGRNEYLAKRTQAVSTAIALDPDNPNGLVMAGTDLIYYGRVENNLQEVLGGKLLLEAAKVTYDNSNRPRSMTTHWAKDFVPFWLNFAKSTIDEFDKNDIHNPGTNN